MPALPFVPTHVITFRSLEGEESVYPVRLSPKGNGLGPAQSWEEWHEGVPASWELTGEGWKFEGMATPSGRCGTITVHDQSSLFLVCFSFEDFEQGDCIATVYPHHTADLAGWLGAARAADFFCTARSRSDARIQLLDFAHEMFPTPKTRAYSMMAIRWVSSLQFPVPLRQFEVNLLPGEHCAGWPERQKTVVFCGETDSLREARDLKARMRASISPAFTSEIYDTFNDYKLF